MTRVLIAVDESDASLKAAAVAHSLFADAEYLVVNVSLPVAGPEWGFAYPVTMPIDEYPPAPAPVPSGPHQRTDSSSARDTAARVAHAASLDDARAVGDVGDPAAAILLAAHENRCDVIVVGSHDRSWFSRLLSGSVSHDVLRESDIPVLVVK